MERHTTSRAAVVSRRDFLRLGAAAVALGPAGALSAADGAEAPPDLLIGYTEFRTDLPGGRYVNVWTMRAAVVKADGTGRRVLAEELTREAGSWTQFVGWSPDGKATKQSPALDKKKSELIKNLVHGMSLSPDGKRSAFEDPGYRLYLADADGSNPKQVKTGLRFHLMPSWSPDGSWVLFVAGEHYDCHPHVIKADGTGLKKLASRNGYRGVIDFLDVYDFHDGSSDLPVWAADGTSVFYTAKVQRNVELFRVTLDGKSEQLTDMPAGSMHYHPQPSPDGKWLLYGSKRDGVRQLYLRRLEEKKERRLTDLAKGHAAMWPHWQPGTNKP